MRFEGDERAQSVLVGSILLFAILIIAFSTYQAFVVPSQNAEVEFNHNTDVQTDLQELRNSLLDVRSVERVGDSEYAIVSEHRPTKVRLGTRYPPRLFALNPPTPSGTLRTMEPATQVQIENARVKNPDRFDSSADLTTLFDAHETRFLIYEPRYREYQRPPTTALEHSLLYNRFSDPDLLVREQNVVNTSRNRITLVLFDGDLSRSGSQAISLDPQTLDGPTAPVPIEPDGGEITLRLPTDSLELWEQSIGELSEAEIDQDASSENEVVITLLADEYTLRMARVGFDGGARTEQFTPIQYESDESTPGSGDETLPGPRVFNAQHDGDEPLESDGEFTLTATVSNLGNTTFNRGGTTIQNAEWYLDIEGETPPEYGDGVSMQEAGGDTYLQDVVVSVTSDLISASDLNSGENTIVIRGQDSRGIWGEETDSVTVQVEEVTQLTLTADQAEIDAEDSNDLTATYETDQSDPIDGEDVTFTIENGDGTLANADGQTDANGEATVTYESVSADAGETIEIQVEVDSTGETATTTFDVAADDPSPTALYPTGFTVNQGTLNSFANMQADNGEVAEMRGAGNTAFNIDIETEQVPPGDYDLELGLGTIDLQGNSNGITVTAADESGPLGSVTLDEADSETVVSIPVSVSSQQTVTVTYAGDRQNDDLDIDFQRLVESN